MKIAQAFALTLLAGGPATADPYAAAVTADAPGGDGLLYLNGIRCRRCSPCPTWSPS